MTVAAGHQPNPYVGPRPFRPGEPIYGRDREAHQLADLLIAKRIVVLHSPSGAGKTSLIQAALIPALRAEGFTVLPIVRVNRAPPATGMGRNGALPNRFLLSALLSLHDEAASAAAESAPRPAPSLADGSETDLVGYLDRRPRANEAPHVVLVVDQFEEILTADPTDQAGIRAFFAEAGRALEDRGRWALFAIREDYLAALEPYVRPIPTRLKTTFRLDLLDPAAARAAIQRPARAAGVDFSDAAAVKLVDDLRRQMVQRPDGTVDAVLGQSVEPMQLQVVCRRLWEQLPPGDRAVVPEQLSALGEVDSVLGDFYAREIEQVVAATGIGEHRLRAWIGDHLLTRQGVRGQALWEPGRGAELNEAIWRLVDGHLVRAEQRRGATWFELAHDRLVEPVRRSNEEWFQANLSALQRSARLWDDEARDAGYLLSGEALDEAQLWAAGHADLLRPVERDFLDACRARKQAQVSRNLRAMVVIGLAAIAIAVLAVALWRHADDQRHLAEVAELVAQAASLGNEQLDRALLLSLAAEQLSPKVETRSTLLREVFDHPNLTRYFWRHATDKEDPSANANVNAIDFNKDGFLASADGTGRIWLWDPATGLPLDIQLNQGEEKKTGINAGALKFSPDGTMLAAGSWRDLVLWNVKTGEPARTLLIEDKTKINALAFRGDGAVLASGDEPGSIRLWDTTTGDPIGPPLNQRNGSASPHPIRALAYNSIGILASGSDGGVVLWDPTTRRLHAQQLHSTPECPTDLAIQALVFSEKNFNLLAVGADDATVTLWDLASGDCLFPPMRGHMGPITDLDFSPKGLILASSSLDGTVVLWDVETGRESERLTRPGHTGSVTSVAFSPDGETLATGSRDESVIVWNVTDKPLWTVLDRNDGEVTSIAFSPDHRTLASGSKDGSVIFWDLATQKPATLLKVSEGWVTSVAFSPDGRTLAVGACKGLDRQGEPCDGGEITLWNAADGTKRGPTLGGFRVGVDSVAFSRDGDYLAAGGCQVKDTDEDAPMPRPHCIRAKTLLWALDAVYAGHDEPAQSLDDRWESAINSILFSRDGKWLVVGGIQAPLDGSSTDHGSIRLWDVSGDTMAPQALGDSALLPKPVLDLALSPDGQTLASGDQDGSVTLWDLATRAQVGTPLSGHTAQAWINAVAFDPTGTFIASGSRDRTSREKPVVIWDKSSLAEFVVFPSLHTGWINDIAFSEDGRRWPRPARTGRSSCGTSTPRTGGSRPATALAGTCARRSAGSTSTARETTCAPISRVSAARQPERRLPPRPFPPHKQKELAMADETYAQEAAVFNGIDGATGGYLTPPLTAHDLATLAQCTRPGARTDAASQLVDDEQKHREELAWRHRRATEPTFAPIEGVDPRDLASAGWGVVFAHDTDPAIREALTPLLVHRREQAGAAREGRYREFAGPTGYQQGESKAEFLWRRRSGFGPVDPDAMPYYLLLVGDPEAIPYRFQSQLDVQHAVGRVWFETAAEYANYAASVVAAETGPPRPCRAAFVAIDNPDDRATALSALDLAVPLADHVAADQPDWAIETLSGTSATKAGLQAALGGASPPALLFAACHGMAFPKGDPRQLGHQGALLCQDWPGPKVHEGPIPPEFYVSVDDIGDDAPPRGMIAFLFACFGAGTPRQGDFAQPTALQRPEIASRSFVAALPRRLLSHQSGGALAVVGHVDRTWSCSFSSPANGRQLAVFTAALKRLLEGYPIGYAFEFFNERYAELATALAAELDDITFGKVPNDLALAELWTASNDARNYAILGDPAVRLAVAADVAPQ